MGKWSHGGVNYGACLIFAPSVFNSYDDIQLVYVWIHFYVAVWSSKHV